MAPFIQSHSSTHSNSFTSSAVANDNARHVSHVAPVGYRDYDDAFTRAYKRLSPKLRAAARQYVANDDVDDLVQDVFIIASQRPSKLGESDSRTLSWLIGIAKRCAPTYARKVQMVPLEDLLEREKGDDREGDEPYEEIPW
jgi:DNA-directed RNA polymerase specialized sigma24 family protein